LPEAAYPIVKGNSVLFIVLGDIKAIPMQARKTIAIPYVAMISALIRQESREAHHKSDFPDLDDERWGK